MVATSDPRIWTYKRIALFECQHPKIQGLTVYGCHCPGDGLCACMRSWQDHEMCFVTSPNIFQFLET